MEARLQRIREAIWHLQSNINHTYDSLSLSSRTLLDVYANANETERRKVVNELSKLKALMGESDNRDFIKDCQKLINDCQELLDKLDYIADYAEHPKHITW